MGLKRLESGDGGLGLKYGGVKHNGLGGFHYTWGQRVLQGVGGYIKHGDLGLH